MTTASPQPSSGPKRPVLVWVALAAIVALAAVVAVVATGGGDDDGDENVATDGTAASSESPVPGSDGATTTLESDGPAEQVGKVEMASDSEPALAPYGSDEQDAAVGLVIPTVSGTQLGTGEPLKIGPDDGAQVILFVAHWCPHCQAEIPRLVDHLAETPLPDGVRLVTVSTAVVENRGNYPPQAWLEGEGWTVPVLADDANQTAAQAFGLTSFPYFVAVDAEGKVVARASGELTMDQFDGLVDAAKGGAG